MKTNYNSYSTLCVFFSNLILINGLPLDFMLYCELIIRLYMGYKNGLGSIRQVNMIRRSCVIAKLSELAIFSKYLYKNSISFYRNAGENKFLREEIVYSSKSYYYFAIIEDFVLRFGWAVSLSLTEMGFSMWGDLITSVLSPLEVFRRFIWNFFRLENEHLNNCGTSL